MHYGLAMKDGKPKKQRAKQITPWEAYINSVVGKGIREMRLKKDIPAVEVAAWLEVSADELYKMERGERRFSLAKVVRVARNFGCTVNELMPGEFTMVPPGRRAGG